MARFQDNFIDENLLDDFGPTEGDEYAPVLSYEEAEEEDRIAAIFSPLQQIPVDLIALREQLMRTERSNAVQVVAGLKETQTACDAAEACYDSQMSDAQALKQALTQISSVLSVMGELSAGIGETAQVSPPRIDLAGTSFGQPVYDPSLLMEAMNLLQSTLDELRGRYGRLAERVQALTELSSQADLITLHCSIEAAKLTGEARDFSTGVVSRISDLSHRVTDQAEILRTELEELDGALLATNSAVSALRAAENETERYATAAAEELKNRDLALADRDEALSAYAVYAEAASAAVAEADRNIRLIGERGGKVTTAVENCRRAASGIVSGMPEVRRNFLQIRQALSAAGQTLKNAGSLQRFTDMTRLIGDIEARIMKAVDDCR